MHLGLLEILLTPHEKVAGQGKGRSLKFRMLIG
jgi:hypothetical protein